MSRRLASLALASATLAPAAHAQILLTRQCQTTWQGQAVVGVAQVERLPYTDTHRVYGQFHDPQNTLIEFEIMTNQAQGVGGMWFNHVRHREIHVHWQMMPDGGFVITGEGGASARYLCR